MYMYTVHVHAHAVYKYMNMSLILHAHVHLGAFAVNALYFVCKYFYFSDAAFCHTSIFAIMYIIMYVYSTCGSALPSLKCKYLITLLAL